MKQCLTKQLLYREVSGCLVENPDCGFAHKFGFSFVCRHPDHSKYYAHASSVMTRNEIREQYDTLRRKRRDEFLAGLDEESRSLFCKQYDFNGQLIPYGAE